MSSYATLANDAVIEMRRAARASPASMVHGMAFTLTASGIALYINVVTFESGSCRYYIGGHRITRGCLVSRIAEFSPPYIVNKM